MLSARKRPPVDYSKCNQTVTIYRQNKDKSVTRAVIDRAFLDFKKTQNVDKTGSTQTNSFLLVIPCSTCPISVGDKVLMGTGPETVDWSRFIPSLTPGLSVIKYVDPKYWNGEMCHVEGGG